MKLVSYLKEDHAQLAFLVDGMLYDTDRLHPDLPVTMTMFLNYWEDIFPIAHMINLSLIEGSRRIKGISIDEVEILAPVPHPVSCRIAFNKLKATLPPVIKNPAQNFEFYFANHNNIQGPGEIICMPDHLEKLDFELQIAIVICKPCKNITASEADEYIGGYMIMNGVSSREMQSQFGFIKGKDFFIAMGPILVTPDELDNYLVAAKENHTGNAYNFSIKCTLNGKTVCKKNVAEMDWTFAEVIEHCSYGVQLYPGDIIGSCVNGAFSFLEINNAGTANDLKYKEQWLQEGDEIEIENLGILKNSIDRENSAYSILSQIL